MNLLSATVEKLFSVKVLKREQRPWSRSYYYIYTHFPAKSEEFLAPCTIFAYLIF